MMDFNIQKRHWFTWQQELLLKAALLQGEDAMEGWMKWKSNVDLEKIDPGSYRLLPLLYYNLNNHEIKDPLMDRLKGIYRRTWFENQILSHKAIAFLENLYNNGIPTIVLKGIALLHLYYKDYGIRPMSDFDILVPTDQAFDAINLLRKAGWTSLYKLPETIIPIIHSCDLTDPEGMHHVDLHWHLFIECCQPNADEDFWNGSLQTIIKDIPTSVLNPADQLLHIFVHGMKWSIIPPFRWIADAIMIIKTSQKELDWNRLITQAEKRRLILPVRLGLEYLKDEFNIDIPQDVLFSFQKVPISRIEQLEYKYKIEDQKRKLLGNIPVLWFDSLRLLENRSLKHKIWSFIKYVKNFWNLEHLWQLPFYTLSLTVPKIRIMTRILLENISNKKY
jgi:hypothetical protein